MLELSLLAIFVTWSYSLLCGFVSDDHATIVGRKDIIPDSEKNPTKESYWVKVFNDGIVIYYINRLMFRLPFGKSPFIWHLLSLVIHLLNSFLLLDLLSGLVGVKVALFTVTLWAVNPMLAQSVAWISGRPYLIGCTLGLLAMLFRDNPLIFIPCYILGVITNISVALIPILVKIISDTWQSNLYLGIMIFAGAPFILWKFKRRFTTSLVLDRENFRFRKRRLFALAKIYGYYLLSLVYPYKMGWYHQCGFKYNQKWEKFNYATLLSIIALLFIAQNDWRGWWFILGILPNANLFATNSFIQDRYVYFGSIGFFILLTPLLIHYEPIYFLILGAFMLRSFEYSTKLSNDESLYRENIRNHPYSDFAYNNLAYFLIQQHKYEEAKLVIFKGLEFAKDNKMLWYNLAICWASTGNLGSEEGRYRFLRSVECWKMALQLEPRWEKPAEDLKKMIKFLADNKVITTDKAEALPDAELQVPVKVEDGIQKT